MLLSNRLDALGMSVAYWTEYLDRDVSREEDKRLEELMEEEYRKFTEQCFEVSPARPNFYDNY